MTDDEGADMFERERERASLYCEIRDGLLNQKKMSIFKYGYYLILWIDFSIEGFLAPVTRCYLI
jgi:hypothetical protein